MDSTVDEPPVLENGLAGSQACVLQLLPRLGGRRGGKRQAMLTRAMKAMGAGDRGQRCKAGRRMNIGLSEEAVEFGHLALRALKEAGGDHLVAAAELEPGRRERLVTPILSELGAWQLNPRGDQAELEAAAALCRSVGYWAVPYPIAERLARPEDLDVDGLLVVADYRPAAAVAEPICAGQR